VLWIALHLPLLSLESFAATVSQACPQADDTHRPPPEGVEETSGGRAVPFPQKAVSKPAEPPPLALMDARCVVSANEAAQALGVKPGLKRATALALAPQLVLGQANPARDAQALLAVAHVALAFTPGVSIQPAGGQAAAPDTVLLDVQRSLRYFGGLQALLQRLGDALAPLGHCIHSAVACTPQGAALLARVHREWCGTDLNMLRAALQVAPVWLLGPGREHWEALQGMGLSTLGDLQRLPRAGLARRFGEALLDELDRALGTRPDLREPITLPPAFESRLELFARADTTEQVQFGAAVLLQRLVAWLSAQHAFVRRFTLVMQHEARRRSGVQTPTETRLDIALAEPSRDAAHLMVLLRERLAALQLPAPTLDLQLHADDIARRPPPNSELFPTAGSEREGLTRLIERLQARLGPEQVKRLVRVQDHRPERAGELQPARLSGAALFAGKRAAAGKPTPGKAATSGTAATGKPAAERSVPTIGPRSSCPVWLLHPPEPLTERHSRPTLNGQPLQLLSGPERIETGWWDAALAERDYFIAQTPEGALVWIYRARLPLSVGAAEQGWFMQGRFA
jgi:protein ImuB